MLQQGNSLHTETVMQMLKDSEITGNFYWVDWKKPAYLLIRVASLNKETIL